MFDHVRSAYGDDGASVYEEAEVSIEEGNLPAGPPSVDAMGERL